MSDERFSVDGTLIKARASMKSFRPKDDGGEDDGTPPVGRNAERDFHGERRSNKTHRSTTDPDARRLRNGKGKEARLCDVGHVLMENHNGLAVAATLTQATATAERDAANSMVAGMPGRHRSTVGADKAYATADFVASLREMTVTPHVAQNTSGRRSAIDGRTTRHTGDALSQRARKRIEEIFGWLKTVGGLRKRRHRGLALVGWMFIFTVAAYNLVRLRTLIAA